MKRLCGILAAMEDSIIALERRGVSLLQPNFSADILCTIWSRPRSRTTMATPVST